MCPRCQCGRAPVARAAGAWWCKAHAPKGAAPVLEVVRGIPIVKKVRGADRLAPGAHVTLLGTPYTIHHVGPSAVYLRPRYRVPQKVEFGDRSFMAQQGGTVVAVSKSSPFVFEGEGV